MKKIISLISAVAIFASMAVTGFAADGVTSDTSATVALETEDRNPAIKAQLIDVDGDGYAYINFVLETSETLSYESKLNKITGTMVNAIQINVTLDEEVFDVASGETYMMTNDGDAIGSSSSASGDGTADLTFVFGPSAIAGYMNSNPEYVCQVAALVKEGYDATNIPTDAITFGACKVEFKTYNGVKAADALKSANAGINYFYTIYGANTVGMDYDLEVAFENEFYVGGGEEGGDNDDTAIEMVAGNQNIVGGRHDGKAAISAPEAVAVEGIAKITVENSADADRVEEWVAPTTLGNGKTKVLAVVTYDKAAMAGTTFTVKYLNAALEAIKTFTYTVGQ